MVQHIDRTGRWYTQAEAIPRTAQYVVTIHNLFGERAIAYTFAFSAQQAEDAATWIIGEFERLKTNEFVGVTGQWERAAALAVRNYDRKAKAEAGAV